MTTHEQWEERVKQGLFPELKLTERMKDAVLANVNQPRPIARFLDRFTSIKAMTIAIMMIAVIALASPWDYILEKDSEPNPSSRSGYTDIITEFDIAYTPLDARTLQPGETIYEADPDILPGLSNKHSPIHKDAAEHILSLSEIDLIDSRIIEGFGTLMNYTLLIEEPLDASVPKDTRYFGIQLDGISDPQTVFHVGYGHMFEMTEQRMTRIFGQSALKIEQEKCRIDGEACAWYYTVEQNKPMLYAMFSSKSYERDLDGDGIEEIIVATNKRNQIYIFKEENHLLYWASIRDIVKADPYPDDLITYHEEDGTFSLTSAEDSSIRRKFIYAAEEGKLQQVNE